MRKLVLSEFAGPYSPTDKSVYLAGPWCMRNWKENTFCPIPVPQLELYLQNYDRLKELDDPFSSEQRAAHYTDLILNRLVRHLNNLHQTQHSRHFWEILLREWTLTNVMLLLHYHDRISLIAQKHSLPLTVEILPDSFKPLYTVSSERVDYTDPRLVLFFCSEAIRALRPIGWKIAEVPLLDAYIIRPAENQVFLYDSSWKSLYGKIRAIKWRIDDKRRMRKEIREKAKLAQQGVYCLKDHGLEREDYRLLSDFLTKPDKAEYLQTAPIAERPSENYYAEVKTNIEIETYLWNSILKIIPSYATTGFLNLKKRIRPLVKPEYKLFFGGMIGEAEDRMLLAISAENHGAKLIGIQHGCNYGMTDFCVMITQIEYRLSDEFITWGWKSQPRCPTRFTSLPSPMLSKVMGSHNRTNSNIIFISALTSPVYFFTGRRLFAENCLQYVLDKKSFLEGLASSIRQEVHYRTYLTAFHFLDEPKYLADHFPEIKFFLGNLNQATVNCKLLVLDNPGTNLLRAMATNTPTVCFFDPVQFPMLSQFMPFLEALEKVGIYHRSPQAAAKFINQNFDTLDAWWGSPDVQNAVNYFRTHNARTDSNWLSVLAAYFRDRIENYRAL